MTWLFSQSHMYFPSPLRRLVVVQRKLQCIIYMTAETWALDLSRPRGRSPVLSWLFFLTSSFPETRAAWSRSFYSLSFFVISVFCDKAHRKPNSVLFSPSVCLSFPTICGYIMGYVIFHSLHGSFSRKINHWSSAQKAAKSLPHLLWLPCWVLDTFVAGVACFLVWTSSCCKIKLQLQVVLPTHLRVVTWYTDKETEDRKV